MYTPVMTMDYYARISIRVSLFEDSIVSMCEGKRNGVIETECSYEYLDPGEKKKDIRIQDNEQQCSEAGTAASFLKSF